MEVKCNLKKRMIKRSIFIFLGVITLLYIMYQVYKSVRYGVKTEPAVMYTLSDSVETKGIIVRNEEIVSWDENGVLMNVLGDGEKISKGGVVAEVYQTDEQAIRIMELRNVEKEIEQLRGLNSLSGMALRGPGYIDKQINQEIRNINLFSKVGNYKSEGMSREKLLYLLNERHIVMGKVENFYERLDDLENKRKDLIKECGSSTGKILAEHSGYFVSQADGYENRLDYKNIRNLNISDLNFEVDDIEQTQKNVAGKIIKSVDWYIVCKLHIDDAMKLKVGSGVDVEIRSAVSENIPCNVLAVNKDDNSTDTVVILSCDRMNKELALIRNEEINININTYHGIRISKSALKEDVISKTVEKDGVQEKSEKKVKGVYVKYGPNLVFKEVVPIYMNSSYIICRDTVNEDDFFGEDTIQVGDEIVVEGINLYDGKHIE